MEPDSVHEPGHSRAHRVIQNLGKPELLRHKKSTVRLRHQPRASALQSSASKLGSAGDWQLVTALRAARQGYAGFVGGFAQDRRYGQKQARQETVKARG